MKVSTLDTVGSVGMGAFLISGPAYAAPSAAGFEGWHGGWGWGHMVFGSLMMLLFWGAAVVAIVVAVRWLGGRGDEPASGRSPALAILEERYARGEIDAEEFEERKRRLSG